MGTYGDLAADQAVSRVLRYAQSCKSSARAAAVVMIAALLPGCSAHRNLSSLPRRIGGETRDTPRESANPSGLSRGSRHAAAGRSRHDRGAAARAEAELVAARDRQESGTRSRRRRTQKRTRRSRLGPARREQRSAAAISRKRRRRLTTVVELQRKMLPIRQSRVTRSSRSVKPPRRNSQANPRGHVRDML